MEFFFFTHRTNNSMLAGWFHVLLWKVCFSFLPLWFTYLPGVNNEFPWHKSSIYQSNLSMFLLTSYHIVKVRTKKWVQLTVFMSVCNVEQPVFNCQDGKKKKKLTAVILASFYTGEILGNWERHEERRKYQKCKKDADLFPGSRE